MKIRYPKKILIGSTEFEMRYDKKSIGACFNYQYGNKKAYIKIGIAGDKLRQLENFIHEVKEIINYEQGVRYTDLTATDNYHFCYDHKQHTDFCSRLAGALSQFIK
jgi:hypothetical protein